MKIGIWNNEEIGGYFAMGYMPECQTSLIIKGEMRENQRINRIFGELEIKFLNEE